MRLLILVFLIGSFEFSEAKTKPSDENTVKLSSKEIYEGSSVSDQKAQNAASTSTQDDTNPDEQNQKNKVSEDFYSEDSKTKDKGFLDILFEDYSWFFQKKRTKRKIGLFPYASSSSTQGIIAGLRLFSYDPDQQGYYLGFYASKPIKYNAISVGGSFIDKHDEGLKLTTEVYYNNYPDFFYGYGMQTEESDQKILSSHKLYFSQEALYLLPSKLFYGFTGTAFVRREYTASQEDEVEFNPELLLTLKTRFGYDSRDSWRGAHKGQYHQASLSCTPSLGYGTSFCMTELDFRYYASIFDYFLFAVRGFAGTSIFGPSSYSLNYTLGGNTVLRAYSENRFRGDKTYFFQSELTAPIPIPVSYLKNFMSIAGFFEAGEVAKYGEKFLKQPQWNVGTGVRFGIPPSYRMKLRADLGFAPLDKGKRMNIAVDFSQAF